MSPSLYVISLQPFNMCTFLIYICVNVPIRIGHVDEVFVVVDLVNIHMI